MPVWRTNIRTCNSDMESPELHNLWLIPRVFLKLAKELAARLWKVERKKIVFPRLRACWKRTPGQKNGYGVSLQHEAGMCSLRLMAARHVLFWDWLLPLLKSPNDTLSTTSGQSMRISGCSPSQESATPTQIDKKPLRIFHLLHQDMFGVRIRVRVLSPQRWSFKLAA